MTEEKQQHEKRLNRIYSKRASRYRWIHSMWTFCFDRYYRRMTAKNIPEKLGNIIEIGTGPGLTSAKILDMGKAETAVAVDFNMDILKQGRNNQINQGTFIPVNADAMALPFNDNSFDAAVTMLGMGGIYDARKAYEEIIRVVKDKGMIYSLEMCTPRNAVTKWVHKILTKKLVDTFWGFSPIDIETIIKQTGIDDYRLRYRQVMVFGNVYQLEARVHKP
ncbi:MAG: class I SAM-dependent methyltransferase [bacterium]|nr:class I SAM-dependent methyltransferase [bacterium]